MKTIRTLCILCVYIIGLLPIYNDEYRRVHHDDDCLTRYSRVFLPPEVWLWTTSPTMMDLGGANHLGTHTRTCGSCVEKYYTSNFLQTRSHIYDGFNDRPLGMSYMCLHSLTPIMGLLTEYFLKYSSCLLLLFQAKARHPCAADDYITRKDHGTCIW